MRPDPPLHFTTYICQKIKVVDLGSVLHTLAISEAMTLRTLAGMCLSGSVTGLGEITPFRKSFPVLSWKRLQKEHKLKIKFFK
jgi:hypothetical protein